MVNSIVSKLIILTPHIHLIIIINTLLIY